MSREVTEDRAPSSRRIDSSTVTLSFFEGEVMTGSGNTESVAALITSNCSASLSCGSSLTSVVRAFIASALVSVVIGAATGSP
jgi:hypothetical protein